MTQQHIFPASASAWRSISRTAYILFGVGVALTACGATTFAVAFAGGSSPASGLLLASGAIGCVGVAGLVVATVMLARLRQPIQVEVTPHRLIWREGKRIATLEYEEVERVELVKDSQLFPGGLVLTYPVVRFIENDGEMMEFEVAFEDRGMVHHSRFDGLGIARAAVPYLTHAVISPALDEFLRTGEVDVDALPER